MSPYIKGVFGPVEHRLSGARRQLSGRSRAVRRFVDRLPNTYSNKLNGIDELAGEPVGLDARVQPVLLRQRRRGRRDVATELVHDPDRPRHPDLPVRSAAAGLAARRLRERPVPADELAGRASTASAGSGIRPIARRWAGSGSIDSSVRRTPRRSAIGCRMPRSARTSSRGLNTYPRTGPGHSGGRQRSPSSSMPRSRRGFRIPRSARWRSSSSWRRPGCRRRWRPR